MQSKLSGLGILVLVVLTACPALAQEKTIPAAAPATNVIDTIKADGQCATFLKAIQLAGLSSFLALPGPYTVLAPADSAFAKIPKQDLDTLFANKTALTRLLKNHIVGRVVPLNQKLSTLEGQDIALVASKGLTLGNAKVVTSDLSANNGIVHVIDSLLIPETKR